MLPDEIIGAVVVALGGDGALLVFLHLKYQKQRLWLQTVLSCPHTIQADSSALTWIRTKVVVECTEAASEHLFLRGAISSWGGNRLQFLKIKRQLFMPASRVAIVQVTVVRLLLCCWKTFYFSSEKPFSALEKSWQSLRFWTWVRPTLEWCTKSAAAIVWAQSRLHPCDSGTACGTHA